MANKNEQIKELTDRLEKGVREIFRERQIRRVPPCHVEISSLQLPKYLIDSEVWHKMKRLCDLDSV